jgi:hypothetical protein
VKRTILLLFLVLIAACVPNGPGSPYISTEPAPIAATPTTAPSPFPTAYAVAPQAREAAFEWKDLAFSADAAYYVRVTQRADPRISGKTNFGAATGFPNEMAWSSPVWVSKQ